MIHEDSWEVPEIFRTIQDIGSVAEEEMRRVFNMGVGMVAVASPDEAPRVLSRLRDRGEEAWLLGEVTEGAGVRFV